jgi:hypothetical protein
LSRLALIARLDRRPSVPSATLLALWYGPRHWFDIEGEAHD